MSAVALAPIIGVSAAIKHATLLMERFASTTLPILLMGATGTGKELFAHHIHSRSNRRGPLVDVNCGGLPSEIADSLLFGHRRGAFTGAVESVVGHLERADMGTLFLDEVVDLPLSTQVKLLRALETGEVQPVGSGCKRHLDFRIIAAAQDDAVERLDLGTFRHDLFQRLAGVVIYLPPLSERPEDILPLAMHFARARGQVLEPRSAELLRDYAWPGNVRELRLAIERAGCLVENGTLPPRAILDGIALGRPGDRRVGPREGGRGRRSTDAPQDLAPAARELLAVYEANGFDARRCAAALRVSLSTVYARLKRAGISARKARHTPGSEFHRNSFGIPRCSNTAES